MFNLSRTCLKSIRKICRTNYNYFTRWQLTKNMSSTNNNKVKTLFVGVLDRYNGITVDSNVENCSADSFHSKLLESIENWKSNNKRGIWFKVSLQHADWVPILAKNGFNFHHANDGYVMMYNWLPEESNNIPPYAHTMLAVGAIVINEHNEILVVKEKHFITSHWKLPGGLLDPGENFVNAAIREVKEETNISCEFYSIISFRHTHKAMFDCSDFYMVVSLRPLTKEIKKCDREIADCQWMKIDDYLNHSSVTELNKLFVQKYLEYKKTGVKIECKYGVHEVLNKDYSVYSIEYTNEK